MQVPFFCYRYRIQRTRSSNPPPTAIIQGNKRRLQRSVVGYTTRHKINSQYYRELMLKYEEDIEELQTEVEKAREGPSNI